MTIPRPIQFPDDGPPRSSRYDDVYYPREGGLEQARAVFLAGCGLPERWRGRRRFTVAELGFGTGLNVLALLELWRREAPAGGQLAIFSVEADPLTAEEAARVLAVWPELAETSRRLLAGWPGRRAGFHRLDLPELNAVLDVAVMDAVEALGAWSGAADAWLLDGFSPANNPAMWSPDLMRLVARRSAPGAVAATYTVAGSVRRALADSGFHVERRPGFGGKRERLEARLAGSPPPERSPSVAVIGAGIAGASLARAFRGLGVEARVFEGRGVGAGASGNHAALVTPRLDAGLGTAAQLHAHAFARAVRLYQALPGAVVARGVLQLETASRDADRFARIATSGLFESGSLLPLDAAEASRLIGEPAPGALRLAVAQVIDPARPLAAWLGEVTPAEVVAVEPVGARWRLRGVGGSALDTFDAVCLANGAELAALWPEAPIQPVRGQLSWAPIEAPPAAAWGSYVAPASGGLVFGATHDRNQTDAAWRLADDQRNLEALAARLPALAARIDPASVTGRGAIRATTPDRLPLAGKIAPGLFVLGGFGSRGFALAPALAEMVAAAVLGAPSPAPVALAQAVAPSRFAERARRRARLPIEGALR